MRGLKQFVASLSLVSLLLLTHMPLAHADVNDFTINSFSADYTLSNNNKHGELAVVETIDLTFTDNNHGILRAIPNSYKNHSLQLHGIQVDSTSGAPAQFTTYQSGGNTVLKIGSPNQTVTGIQKYQISYVVDNVIGFYPDHDELYWDINGDQWQQPFTLVIVDVHLPSNLKLSSNQPLCYAGSFGSTSQACTVNVDSDSHMLTAKTTTPLSADQTLTIVAGFQKGYFQPYTTIDYVKQYAPLVMKLLALPVITFIFAYTRWRKKGRDAKGRGVIIPQYDTPKGLTPIDVGTIMDFKTDNRDISATLIDLAVRHYIKIIETRKDKLIGKDQLSYTLELVNNDFSALNAVESQLLSALFDQLVVGDQVELKKKGSALYTAATDARKSTADTLAASGYFRASPLKASTGLYILAAVLFGAVWAFGSVMGPWFAVGAIISVGIVLLFARIMPARTDLGAEALEHAKGLQLFLQVTEKDRLKKLQGPNAEYASSHEPVKTVDLFEKLLPYAMVLGVEKEWAGQFTNLYSQPPSWYGGNFSTFSTIYLLDNLNINFNSAVNTAFTPPSSSGSSGFGGGGFSGGGGGGGGGGGW